MTLNLLSPHLTSAIHLSLFFNFVFFVQSLFCFIDVQVNAAPYHGHSDIVSQFATLNSNNLIPFLEKALVFDIGWDLSVSLLSLWDSHFLHSDSSY